jgi:anti-anti-sigma factor
MDVAIKTVGDTTVISLVGDLDTTTAPDADKALKQEMDRGARKILVGFARIDYVSSAGLRVLLAAAKRLRGDDGDLCVCDLNNTVEEIFDMSGFSSILKVYPDESAALADL